MYNSQNILIQFLIIFSFCVTGSRKSCIRPHAHMRILCAYRIRPINGAAGNDSQSISVSETEIAISSVYMCCKLSRLIA